MGYESRLYIVRKTSIGDFRGKMWAQIIASIEMHENFTLFEKFTEESKHYIIIEGKIITNDYYGDPLKEMSLKDCIKAISEIKKDHSCRRNRVLMPMLLAFDTSEWEDIAVIHYGH